MMITISFFFPVYAEGNKDHTYIPLRESAHTHCDESSLPVTWRLDQCRPAHLRRRVLHFNGPNDFGHFEVDQGMGDIAVRVIVGE